MSLELIETAIEKIAKEKDHTARNTAIAGAVGAGLGTGAALGSREYHVRRTLNALGANTPELRKGAREAFSKAPMGESLKAIGEASKLTGKSPLLNKMKYLASKKRVMAPVGAALAAGGYLAARKKKED